MRASRCVCGAVTLFLGMSVAVFANSYFVGGTISAVGQNGGSCVIEGLDHYGNKSQGLIVSMPLQLGDNDCYILDGRLVRREVAMAPGRAIFDIQHRIHIVLSEPATRLMGQVVKVDGDRLVLKTLLGQDKRETNVTVEADAQYRLEGKPSTRDALLIAGNILRVAPSRSATLLAYTEKSLAKAVPPAMSVALQGIMKGGKLLYVGTDGAAAELARAARTGICVDLCNPLGTSVPTTHPCMAAGCPAVAVGFVKRGEQKRPEPPTLEGLESYLVTFWPEAGRVDGEVTTFDSTTRSLSVKSLHADGFKAAIVTLPPDAQVLLDGAKSTLSAALKVGTQISLYPARPQTIESWESVTSVAKPRSPPPPPSSPPPPAQPAAKPVEKSAEEPELPSL